MAYTQVQTLVDTDRRHVTKRVNSGNTESSALVVNAASLAYALSTVTLTAGANNFVVGETINAASNGSAVVQDVINSTSIIVSGAAGTFTNATVLTGATSGRTRVLANNGVVAQTYNLQVTRLIFNIGGNANAAIELMWEGAGGGSNNRTLAILSGSDVYELDTHAMRANNTANSATGNLILSTLNWDAGCHYTLALDINKTSGYALPFGERNTVGW